VGGSRDVAALIGRILLAVLFVVAGYGKIGGFERTAAAIASKGLPLPAVGTAITIAVELLGGMMVVLGWRTRWAAAVLIVFTMAATYFFHDYWNMVDQAARTNQIMFLKNIAVIGGLIFVWAFGPGRISVDRG
jgi:putative oxidoreductase